ncbi:MAG: hypothetical protein U5L04_07910 [Trueperaceae bacterium]|nr:hypothetical protein [Trueperaceae bacterium]
MLLILISVPFVGPEHCEGFRRGLSLRCCLYGFLRQYLYDSVSRLVALFAKFLVSFPPSVVMREGSSPPPPTPIPETTPDTTPNTLPIDAPPPSTLPRR